MQMQRPTVIFPAAGPHCPSHKNLYKLSLKRFVLNKLRKKTERDPRLARKMAVKMATEVAMVCSKFVSK